MARIAILLLSCLFPISHTIAAPGDVLYAEDFSAGTANGWNQTGGNGTTGVGEFPNGSGNWSFYTCCGSVTAQGPVVDTAVAGAQVYLEIQRGSNGIGSNKPEANDYLDVYFLDSGNNWQFIQRYPGGGTTGEAFSDTHVLPAAMLHSGFSIRLVQNNGNAGSDYWHLREVRVIEAGASGGVGSFCDDFESGLSQWEVVSSGGYANVTSQTANSGASSLALNGGAVSVSSSMIDISKASSVTLTAWIRRGDDAFSEDPESGEDLTVTYLDNTLSWQSLETFDGGGTPGQIYQRSYSLPANALHSALRIRFSLSDGSGRSFDFWHIDDVCLDIARTLHHLAISHDGGGVNCQAEPVEIIAHDEDHFVVENHLGTVALGTSTNHGDWSLVSGSGTLNNSGNGAGSYAFATADNGRAILGLKNTFVETVNIDISQGGVVEDASEDDVLAFAETGFNFLVNGGALPIATQIAAKPSNTNPGAAAIALQAIRTDNETGGCEAAFQGNVTVSLAFSCEEPSSCAGRNVIVNGIAVAGNNSGSLTAFTDVALDFGDATQDSAAVVFSYPDAGKIRLHARKPLSPSGAIMTGSSNEFVVRPFGFHIVTDQGEFSGNNPGAADVNGTAFERAGAPFRVTVYAVGWQAADDANADGYADGHDDNDPTTFADLSDNPVLPNFSQENANADGVTLSARLVSPSGGTNPGLGGTTGITSFSAGAGSVSDLSWSEVGDIPARSAHVGRFTPHHLVTEVAKHGCSDADGFGYSGQPLAEFAVTAKNASGGTTANYDGASFARDITVSAVTTAAGMVMNSGISSLDFSAGSVTVTATPAGIGFLFDNKESAPANVAFRAIDADGISSAGYSEGLTEVRSARLAMTDARAPMVASATSGLSVERYTGAAWTEELQDICTSLDTTRFTLTDYGGNLDPGETALDALNTWLVNGAGQAVLTAPGVSNDGEVRLNYEVESWLEFDWNGTGAEAPAGTMSFFEIFSTEPGMIYREEVIN